MAEAYSSAGGSESSTNTKKILELQSSDNTICLVTEAVAKQSVVMKNLLELIEDTTKIKVDVNSHVLRKMVHYCKQHAKANTMTENDLKEWDKAFMAELDQDTLFGITKAAHYLDVTGLTELTTQTVADNIMKMELEDIGTYMNFSEDETTGAVKWAKAKMKMGAKRKKLWGHTLRL